MSDPNNPKPKSRTTPQWGLYQRELFWKDNTGELPLFSTDQEIWRLWLRRSLLRLVLRILQRRPIPHPSRKPAGVLPSPHHSPACSSIPTGATPPRLSSGHTVSAPIGFAPIGINKIYHPLGELPVATVARELNLLYCLSTAGSTPIEAVGAANGSGPRFFQLYMPHDDELTLNLLNRAHDSGFSACILTLLTWQLGWRHHDTATSNYAFYHGVGADLGLSDPAFQRRLKEMGINPETMKNEAGAAWIDAIWHGRAWSWEKLPWLMEQWARISGGKPFVLKRIQSVGDARKAVEMSVNGIVVSNHAGRQVDGAVASLDALEKIVAAVGDKTYIMFDSGIRGAADVFKALALGQSSCLWEDCGFGDLALRESWV